MATAISARYVLSMKSVKLHPKPAVGFSSTCSIPGSPRNVGHVAISSYPHRRSAGIHISGAYDSTGVESLDLLDTVKIFGLDGKPLLISELWTDRKAVVAFARHFGCLLCRKRADYLAAKKGIMDSQGVALVLIGPGSVDQACAFYEQTKFEGEVYADPTYASYEALNFVSGIATTFTLSGGLKVIQSYMEGYRQDWKLSFEKETLARGGMQQGGIIVAGPGKTNISYIHRDKEAGDDPDIQEVLRACCS